MENENFFYSFLQIFLLQYCNSFTQYQEFYCTWTWIVSQYWWTGRHTVRWNMKGKACAELTCCFFFQIYYIIFLMLNWAWFVACKKISVLISFWCNYIYTLTKMYPVKLQIGVFNPLVQFNSTFVRTRPKQQVLRHFHATLDWCRPTKTVLWFSLIVNTMWILYLYCIKQHSHQTSYFLL